MSDPVGRPSVLNDEKKDRICTIIMTGAPRQVAAEYVGCHVETIRRAAMRDPEFASQLSKAEAESQLTPIGAIREAAKKDWRAAAWALERYFPNRYGKRNPETLTKDQVNHVVRQYAETIVAELKSPKLRRKLQVRLNQLARRISQQLPPPAHGKRPAN